MDARVRLNLGVFLTAALGMSAGGVVAFAQAKPGVETQIGEAKTTKGRNTSKTVRKVRVAEEDASVAPAVIQAETAIEKRDYALAESLLQKVVATDPRDYRAWFDLGYVFNVTGRRTESIEAYKKSVAIKPSVQEANLNLGILLAGAGQNDEAAKYLRAATTLKPDSKDSTGPYRAWLSLGRVLQTSAPTEAIAAYRAAAKLDAKDAEPHLSLAHLLERTDAAAAEAEYKQALVLDAKSTDAMAGLINLYTQTNRLSDAEAFLRAYLEAAPENVAANLQLGRLFMKAGKTEAALGHFEAGLKANPNDRDLLHAVAAMYGEAKKYPEAEERYRALVKAAPQDAGAHRDLARVLTKQRKFPEAEAEFFKAIKLEPKHGETYGEFAMVTAQNKKYGLVIRALDERAKFATETPGTYFLRATAYDNLKAFKEAAENYRKFLGAAQGKFPDQEWQARHRLIAIDPDAAKKK